MKVIKLITIVLFICSGGLAIAQDPNDPHLIGKDGLPATRPPRYESNYGRESENSESNNRRHNTGVIDPVENRDQYEEEFSSEQSQDKSHFKADSISVYFFDDKGKRINNPLNIYQKAVDTDSVKTKVNNSAISPDSVEVDNVNQVK